MSCPDGAVGNGVLSQSPKESIPGTHTWEDVVRLIWVEIGGCPQVSNVSSLSVPLRKKFSLIFTRPRRRTSFQILCTIVSIHVSAPSGEASVPSCALACWSCAQEHSDCPGPRQLLGPPGQRMHKRRGQFVLPSNQGITVKR